MGRPLLILHLLLHLPAASGLVPAWGRAQCRCLASVLHSYQSETGKTHLPKIKKLFIKQRPEVFIFIIYFLLCRFSRITLRSSRGFFFSAVQADLQHTENLLCLDSAHTAVITQSRDSGSHRTKCCQLWREELAGDKKPQGLVQGLSKHSPPPPPQHYSCSFLCCWTACFSLPSVPTAKWKAQKEVQYYLEKRAQTTRAWNRNNHPHLLRLR